VIDLYLYSSPCFGRARHTNPNRDSMWLERAGNLRSARLAARPVTLFHNQNQPALTGLVNLADKAVPIARNPVWIGSGTRLVCV
jgi:hypothetical protein